MEQPYRVPGRKKKKRKAARELIYAPGQEKLVAPARAALQIFIAGSLVGSVLVLNGWGWLGVAIFAVTLVLGYRSLKKPRVSAGAVLSIEKGWLKVYRSSEIAPRLRVALSDVREVTLDTRTIQRGGGDVGALAGLGGSGSGGGADLARIAIVVEAEPVPSQVTLTDEYFPRIDGVEWLGKIRTFLRSHRWLPHDERAEELDDDDV